jgi:hypothetical protein
MVFRQGIKNRKITVNPAREIERRKENNIRDRYLLEHEEQKLRGSLPLFTQNACQSSTSCYTGMRRSEQYECEWS